MTKISCDNYACIYNDKYECEATKITINDRSYCLDGIDEGDYYKEIQEQEDLDDFLGK